LDIPVITAQQFATKFALQPNQYAWFLGAGASASAGIPTGYAMIRDFKAQLFCQETKLPRREVDATDPLWVERIDDFFKRQAILPPAGDPTEYAKAFEAVYPSERDRRAYIDSQVKLGRPSFAHRVLASLLSTGNTPCVFTTNFDSLVETATTVAGQLLEPAKRRNLVVAAIDSAERAKRCLAENDWPLLAKIHGDFQSIELKNTDRELAEQDARMRAVLVEACSRFALVVIGYSGRDASVMAALNDVLKESTSFPGGIYWVTRSPSELLPAVRALLRASLSKGVGAHIVQSQNFDEFAGDLADVVSMEEVLEQHIHAGEVSLIVRPAPLPTHEALEVPILRCSAVRVLTLPTVARRLVLQKPVKISEIRKCLRESKARATVVAAGNEYAAFGSDETLLSALAEFGPKLAGTIDLNPVDNSWALGLLYDALTRALCRGRPLHPRLQSRGHSVLVSAEYPNKDEERLKKRLKALAPMKGAYGIDLYGKVPKLGYPFNEAVRIRLEQAASHWWCVFDPYTSVDLPKDVEESTVVEVSPDESRSFQWKPHPAGDWLRERWARRYNGKWSAIITAWSDLFKGEGRAFWLDDGQGIDAVFQIGAVTAWSRPSHDHPYFHGRR
jgi:hypothetical protein